MRHSRKIVTLYWLVDKSNGGGVLYHVQKGIFAMLCYAMLCYSLTEQIEMDGGVDAGPT